jgi:hypothetical protein
MLSSCHGGKPSSPRRRGLMEGQQSTGMPLVGGRIATTNTLGLPQSPRPVPIRVQAGRIQDVVTCGPLFGLPCWSRAPAARRARPKTHLQVVLLVQVQGSREVLVLRREDAEGAGAVLLPLVRPEGRQQEAGPVRLHLVHQVLRSERHERVSGAGAVHLMHCGPRGRVGGGRWLHGAAGAAARSRCTVTGAFVIQRMPAPAVLSALAPAYTPLAVLESEVQQIDDHASPTVKGAYRVLEDDRIHDT